ncbi:MAG: hypothetical protein IMF19_16390 [Proteobacteria bacterium]|nr:hypothetical protein [Pseudomonadota bacterium]
MAIGKYIFYKIEDRRFSGLCRGLGTMIKFLRILKAQKIKDVTMHESEKYYTVKFFSEAK